MNRRTAAWAKRFAFLLCVAALCGVVWMRSRAERNGHTGLGRSFRFDMERYLDVDPALVRFDEAPAIPIALERVTAIAAGADGHIYVGGERTVLVLNANGDIAQRIAVDDDPRCLAVDDAGNVYAGIGNHVEVFDADGKRTATWDASAPDAIPVSIALSETAVFVGEAKREQVLHFDRNGQWVDSIQGFVLFSSPILGMTVDAQQNLWVANPGERELRRYDRNGVMDRQWSHVGRTIDRFSGCCNPVDIAIRADGNIVTSEKNIVRVKVVSPTGELVGVVAGPRSFDQGIEELDVAIDARGRILVLDPVKKAVRVFVEKQK